MEFAVFWLLASIVFLCYGAWHKRDSIINALKFNFKYLTITAAITVVMYFGFWYFENHAAALAAGMVVLSGSFLLWCLGVALWGIWFLFLSFEWVLRVFCYPFHCIRAKRLGDDPRSFAEYVFDGQLETEGEVTRWNEWWDSLSSAEQRAYIAEQERRDAERQAEIQERAAVDKAERLERNRRSKEKYANFGKSTQPMPSQTPRQAPKQQTYTKPRESNAYFVERMGPGQTGFQKVTGSCPNMKNAQLRQSQAERAYHGTDSRTGNASKARYRIVDKNGKVQ